MTDENELHREMNFLIRGPNPSQLTMVLIFVINGVSTSFLLHLYVGVQFFLAANQPLVRDRVNRHSILEKPTEQ